MVLRENGGRLQRISKRRSAGFGCTLTQAIWISRVVSVTVGRSLQLYAQKTPTGTEDVEYLTTVSKDDVLALFLARVHPSSKTRSKLSVHLQSQKPQSKHVSRAAADAFVQAVQEHGTEIEGIDWSDSLYADGEPTETQFSAFWKAELVDAPAETSDKVFAALPHLLEQFPAQRDAQGSLSEDVIHIKDVVAFRKSLKVSESPKPLVAWNDLPTPRI
jgi:insulysin